MKLLVAVLAAVAPGAIVCWWGRRVVASVEIPALAELWWSFRRRSAQLAGIGCVAVILTGGRHTLWLAPLEALLVLAGGFPARRAVMAESWGFVGYLGWLARIILYFGSFWALILMAPLLVDLSGEAWPWAAGALAALLFGRLLCPVRVMLRLLGVEPMPPGRVAGLDEFAEQVAASSTARRPALYRLPMRGGRWVNALAVPHRRSPGVVFSEPLLELLEPIEVRAVYAHEVAHLEQYHSRFILRASLTAWSLAVLALGLVPAANLLLGSSSWFPAGWAVLVLVVMSTFRSRHRGREREGDLRALALCHDAEALVSSLVKLHEANRVPRRLSGQDEDRSTHPSLARRIQAIRAAAGRVETTRETPLPTIVPGLVAGEYVAIEAERVTWLQGVPADAFGDLDAMRARAAATRSQSIEQTRDLRVELRRGGRHRLAVKDTAGRSWTVPIAAEGVAALQRALDAVDSRLAPTPTLGVVDQVAKATLLVRLCAVLAILVAMPLGGFGAIAVTSVLVAVYPRAAFLLAAATGVATGALISWLRAGGGGPLGTVLVPSLVLTLVVAVVDLAVGWARAARFEAERSRGLGLLVAALGASLGAVWLAVAAGAWFSGDGTPDLYRLHSLVRHAPSLVAFPLAIAAALAAGKGLRRRAAAALAATTVVLPLWLAGDGFRRAHVRDPLLPTEFGTELDEAAPRLRWECRLEAAPSVLRVSPGGDTVLVGEHAAPEEYGSSPVGPEYRWSAVRADSCRLVTLAEPALEARLLDGERALLLCTDDRAANAEGRGLRLEQRTLDGASGLEWEIALPQLTRPRLEIDPGGRRWQVTGAVDGTGSRPSFKRLQGSIGSDQLESTSWYLGESETWPTWTALGPDAALACGFDPEDPQPELGLPLSWLFRRSQTTLRLVDPGGVRELVKTRLGVACQEGPGGEIAALCTAGDGEWSHVWRMTADGRLSHLSSLRAGYWVLHDVAEGHALLWSAGVDPALVELASGRTTRLRFPDAGFHPLMALAGGGKVAVARMTEHGSSVAVFDLSAGPAP